MSLLKSDIPEIYQPLVLVFPDVGSGQWGNFYKAALGLGTVAVYSHTFTAYSHVFSPLEIGLNSWSSFKFKNQVGIKSLLWNEHCALV